MKSWLTALALLTVPTLLQAQQDYQTYFEEFDVILYQLQVNVRDRDGNHVPGLTKEDFDVRVKGKTQSIETLEEVVVDAWLKDDNVLDPPERSRRLFVFLFDLRYTSKKGVLASREAAREFVLNDMLPSDLIGVFIYNQLSGVSMVNNFTSDQDQLLTSIDWLGLHAAQNVVPGPSGYFFNGEIQGLVNERLGSGASLTEGDGVIGNENDALDHFIEIYEFGRRSEQRVYQREVASFLNSFEKFSDGLRLIRGRKNLVWFSAGFDSRSLTGGTVEELERNQRFIEDGQVYAISGDLFGNATMMYESRQLLEHLQSSGTVIFSVDTSMSGDSAANKPGVQALNMFAVDTGGKAFLNYADLNKPLVKVKELTNDYYLLSFYPDAKYERGEVARLNVRVKGRNDLRVISPKGMLIEPDFEKLTTLEKQIHLSEYLSRDQVVTAIPVSVNALPVPDSGKFVKLSVSVEIRGDYFVGLRDQQKMRDMEIHALVISKEGKVLFDQNYAKFRLEPKEVVAKLRDTGIKYYGNLFVKPGDYRLKVVVRDLANGKVGSNMQDLVIEDDYMPLTGPVLLTEDSWLVFRESVSSQRKRREGIMDYSHPYEMRGVNLVPKARSVIEAEERSNQKFLFLISGEQGSEGNIPDVKAAVMDKDGNMMPIPAEALAADAEYRGERNSTLAFVLKVDFASMELKSGENYKLMTQFRMKDRSPLRATSEFILE